MLFKSTNRTKYQNVTFNIICHLYEPPKHHIITA